MNSLKNYIQLTEKKREGDQPPKVAVFTFGRFQPPTKGHEKIIHSVESVAHEKNGTPMIYPSQTTDNVGRNPLGWVEKIHFLNVLFPNSTIVQNEQSKTAWNVIEQLDEAGFTEVYLVCGSDRLEEYNRRWLPYAEKVFDKAGVISAGSRDPDDETSVAGMSGSKARKAAEAGNIGAFRAATGWDGKIAAQLMASVRDGLTGNR